MDTRAAAREVVADIKAANARLKERKESARKDSRREQIERAAYDRVKADGNSRRSSFSFAGLPQPWKK